VSLGFPGTEVDEGSYDEAAEGGHADLEKEGEMAVEGQNIVSVLVESVLGELDGEPSLSLLRAWTILWDSFLAIKPV
jgi:hypothetical protein